MRNYVQKPIIDIKNYLEEEIQAKLERIFSYETRPGIFT